MPDLLDRFVYRAASGARFSWYLGQKLLAERLVKPTPTPPDLKARLPSTRALMADLRAVLAADLAHVEAGDYAPPADLAPDPVEALRRARAFFRDLGRVDARRHAEGHQEAASLAPVGSYPRYYLQNFHYQSDGYLSADSAALYDHQVEVLFLGGADAMRRQALPALRARLGDRPDARVLDVACGTGRFLSAIQQNFPGWRLSGVDLSPPYLAAAARALGAGATLVQANAEALPLPAGSADAVTCVYLFHELPRAVRARVVGEIARVLAPGGIFVLVDSLQRGDVALYDPLLDRFPGTFHEPYYADYVAQDLTALLADAGLRVDTIELAFLSKVVVATPV
ncbi:MAG: class I SAM-dependent methyltransferase [Alphaproteobacteria bacterium]|nr:class I SAM-dependent methyltransferase [Alphaproteobacteria bacterium]